MKEYVIGRIELPPQIVVGWPMPWGSREVELVARPVTKVAAPPVDARIAEHLEQIVIRLAERFPEYVAFNDESSAPLGYRRSGPGHWTRE